MIATTTRLALCAVALGALASACTSTTTISVSVSPESVSVLTNASQQFTASVTGSSNANVTWAVTESAGGTINPDGLYVAPDAAGTYHVVATSAADTTKSATATVTVTTPILVTSVSISPTSASVQTGATVQFNAQVNGAPSSAVTWSVAPGGVGGSINSLGLYSAPSSAGHAEIVATSIADTTKSATAAVTVTLSATPAPVYSVSSLTCVVNVFCSLAAPTNSGGAADSFAVAPALPSGLSVDPNDGAISGVPLVVSATATYAITATNAGGAGTAFLAVTVDDVAPSTLTYSTESLICIVGTPCALAAPTNSGGAIISYSVSPTLPAGLGLDAATGAISGTATTITPTATFIITGVNSGGSTFARLNVTVIDAAPANLAYSSNALICVVQTPCGLAAPTSTGGAVLSYSVNQQLPVGLTLDPSTGAISGTPSIITPSAIYVITASNTGGSASVDLSIAVNDFPPTSIVYSPNSLTCVKGVGCTLGAPTTMGGAVTNFSVSPALPAGLGLNPGTGAIAGAAEVVAASATYTVTASNSGGSISTTITVVVNDQAPINLSYTPSTLTCTAGSFCKLAAPTNSGGTIVSYASNPPLPTGLGVDPNSGIISGTPSTASPSSGYIITGINSGGSASTTVTVQVNAATAPSGLNYSPNTLTCTINVACDLAAPTNSGGAIDSYSISPALPAGLALSTGSGAISGIPTALSANMSYLVTGTNPGGSSSASVTVTVVAAQAAPWTALGPAGGMANLIIASPQSASTFYALITGGAIFRSTDSGAEWTAIDNGLQTDSAITLATDAFGNLYAGTENGIFSSSNGGDTWTQLGFTGRTQSIAPDPFTDGTLYIATSVQGDTNTVYVSTNAGASFTASDTGIDASDYGTIAADPTNQGVLYFSNYLHVYKSTNAGLSWTESDTGIAQDESGLGPIVIDPTNSNNLYVPGAGDSVVYASSNAGASWTSSNNGIPSDSFPQYVLVNPATPSTLFLAINAGALVSTDSGASWSGLPVTPGDAEPIGVNPSSGFFFASDSTGIYCAQAEGFSDCSSGFDAAQMLSVTIAPDGSLYAGGNNGTWLSNNLGQSWTQLDSNPSLQVAVDASTQVAANLVVLLQNGTVETSTNDGASFTPNASDNENFLTLAFPPAGGPTVYAGSASGGFYISSDDGNTWTSSSAGLVLSGAPLGRGPHGKASPAVVARESPPVVSIAVESDNPTNILAVANAGAFISTNSGASWTQVSGLPASGEQLLAASNDPTRAQTFYVAGSLNLYVSTNGGASFSVLAPNAAASISFVAVNPTDGTICLGTPAGLLTSIDSGASFQLVQTDGLISTDLRAAAFFAGKTYVAAYGGSVEVSATGGR